MPFGRRRPCSCGADVLRTTLRNPHAVTLTRQRSGESRGHHALWPPEAVFLRSSRAAHGRNKCARRSADAPAKRGVQRASCPLAAGGAQPNPLRRRTYIAASEPAARRKNLSCKKPTNASVPAWMENTGGVTGNLCVPQSGAEGSTQQPLAISSEGRAKNAYHGRCSAEGQVQKNTGTLNRTRGKYTRA